MWKMSSFLKSWQNLSKTELIALYKCSSNNFAKHQTRQLTVAKNTNTDNDSGKALFPFSNLSQSDKDSQTISAENIETTGGDSKSKKKSDKYMNYMLLATGVSLAGSALFVFWSNGKDLYDYDGKIIIDPFSDLPLVKRFIARNIHEFDRLRKFIDEPSREKLLPDPLKYPYYQPPYTLILEFNDFLVHPEWTYVNGWRFKKRPGIDKFLSSLHDNFEIVVYTAESGMNVFPILEVLDKNNYISYKLVRDSTNFMDGHHVKDLNRLNRDLNKVIVIDYDEKNVKNHATNLFKIPKWTGDNDDRALEDLAVFLNMIVESEIEDVREVLKYYLNFDDPLAEFLRRKKAYSDDDNKEKESITSRFTTMSTIRDNLMKH